MKQVSIQVLAEPTAKLPEYQTLGAAGADLCCTESIHLAPGERCLAKTGLRVALPDGFEAQVRPRSGLALKHGLSMVNTPGTIDSDYRGEIGVLLINHGQESVSLEAGTRIAQLVVAPVVRAIWEPVDVLPESNRNEGGFGSTGTH